MSSRDLTRPLVSLHFVCARCGRDITKSWYNKCLCGQKIDTTYTHEIALKVSETLQK